MGMSRSWMTSTSLLSDVLMGPPEDVTHRSRLPRRVGPLTGTVELRRASVLRFFRVLSLSAIGFRFLDKLLHCRLRCERPLPHDNDSSVMGEDVDGVVRLLDRFHL